MSDMFERPEMYGDPTQQQLDDQRAMAEVMGWRRIDGEDAGITFHCDGLADEWNRCPNEISVPTPGMDYDLEAYKIARAAMLEAGWTYGPDHDYCPRHSRVLD